MLPVSGEDDRFAYLFFSNKETSSASVSFIVYLPRMTHVVRDLNIKIYGSSGKHNTCLRTFFNKVEILVVELDVVTYFICVSKTP